MILEILKYGHPVLRQKGALVTEITPEIRQLIADMFETMAEEHGIGLAAQQTGHALQVTVIDVRPSVDRPSWVEREGQRVAVDEFMPLVLINPEVTPVLPPVAGLEGCLSFPEVYGEIERPEVIDVRGLNEKGERLEFRCGGLLCRAVQHELDHLHGILFIDRMSQEQKNELKPQLEALRQSTKPARS